VKRRVLIIEDEAILRKNLCRYLAQGGFEVKGALSGEEAHPMLRSCGIEILLLDLGLPDCDGFTLLKQARTLYPHMPAVIMTGQEDSELESRAYQLGARAFFKKPVALAVMKGTLREIAESLDRGER
jgi:DNA-binding NtrC family response regulator